MMPAAGPLPMGLFCCDTICVPPTCWGTCQPSAIDIEASTGPSGSCCPIEGTYAINQTEACLTTHSIPQVGCVTTTMTVVNFNCCEWNFAAVDTCGEYRYNYIAICYDPECIARIVYLHECFILITLNPTTHVITVKITYQYKRIDSDITNCNGFNVRSIYDYSVEDYYELEVDCETNYDNIEIPHTSQVITNPSSIAWTPCDPLVVRLRA